MSYIQNKLDAFRKNIYGDNDALFDRNGNNVSTQVENEFVGALTDYHNHIVEKIVKDVDMTDQQLQDIISLLQDTKYE